MADRTHGSSGIQYLLAILVSVILAYAVLTGTVLLGILAASIIVIGYHFVRWIVEFTRLFRRLVVALERIAENS